MAPASLNAALHEQASCVETRSSEMLTKRMRTKDHAQYDPSVIFAGAGTVKPQQLCV